MACRRRVADDPIRESQEVRTGCNSEGRKGRTMNLEQFRTILDIESRGDKRTVLPVANPAGEQIFGGQILAHLVPAAPPGRTVKSVHAAFPRSGRPRDPLFLDLEKTHAARPLAMRRAV